MVEWICPNCDRTNRTSITEKVCEYCGYSEELPEDDDAPGYY